MFMAIVLSAISCSDNLQKEHGAGVEVEGVSVVLESDKRIEMPSTRASLVLLTDPSLTSIINRGLLGWLLDVNIYKGASVYSSNTYQPHGVDYWIPTNGAITYFPNYLSQSCEFTFYATSPTETIAFDQSVADVMLHHDKLYLKTTMAPAHILTPRLLHANSMLYFSFEKITAASVQIKIGSDLYTPYHYGANYMVILPATINQNPVVVVTTTGGAVYNQTVKIINNPSLLNPSVLGVNNRYVFKLSGYDLVLSPIAILDWVSGGMVAGEYVAETAYPTFRGPANTNCTLTFNNGLTQQLNFNSQGEHTVKPAGRTITAVNSVPCLVVLGQMIIDLNAYLIP